MRPPDASRDAPRSTRLYRHAGVDMARRRAARPFRNEGRARVVRRVDSRRFAADPPWSAVSGRQAERPTQAPLIVARPRSTGAGGRRDGRRRLRRTGGGRLNARRTVGARLEAFEGAPRRPPNLCSEGTARARRAHFVGRGAGGRRGDRPAGRSSAGPASFSTGCWRRSVSTGRVLIFRTSCRSGRPANQPPRRLKSPPACRSRGGRSNWSAIS